MITIITIITLYTYGGAYGRAAQLEVAECFLALGFYPLSDSLQSVNSNPRTLYEYTPRQGGPAIYILCKLFSILMNREEGLNADAVCRGILRHCPSASAMVGVRASPGGAGAPLSLPLSLRSCPWHLVSDHSQ